jgi:hypothetical protein
MISRRLFLRNSAAASVSLAAVAAPVVATPAGSADLVRIVADIEKVEAASIAAEVEKEAARARYAVIKPEPPERMVVPLYGHSYRHPLYHVSETERDCFQYPLNLPDPRQERKIVSSWSFERQYQHLLVRRPGRLSEQQRWAREFLVEIKRYEAAVEAARTAARCDEAYFHLDDHFSRMSKLGEELAATPAKSGRDLALKAAAFDRHKICMKRQERGYYNDSLAANALKADIVALFGGAS